MLATHTSDGKKRKVADTDTTNGNSPQKLLINRTIPVIILPINPPIVDGVAASRGTTYERQTIFSNVIITDAARSSAHVYRNPAVGNRKDTDMTIQRVRNASISPPRLTSRVIVDGGTSVSPTRTGTQEISSTSRPIGPVEVRNAQPFHTFINGNYTKNGDLTPTFSKIISCKVYDKSSADVYLRCRLNFTRDTVITKIPNFMNLELSSVHTSDELGSFVVLATRIGGPTNVSNWLPPGHIIGEVTVNRMSRMRSDQNYSSKTDFETRREI